MEEASCHEDKREHLEDLCLRLQEENSLLRQHTRTQEQRLRRVSTRLMRLRQARPGSAGVKERDMEDTIQELEAHVAMLESQKGVLQNKLSLAKQHIMDLGGRTPYKFSKGKSMEVEGAVRRAAQTAPARYGPMMEENRAEMERLITIRENVDLIRLQNQLSNKSTTLRVTQEKFNDLQEAYENQLEESQRSLKESQGALLEKVEELTEQLKQEKQSALALQGQLTTAALSLQGLDKLQERISDLEGERDTIKENYDTLLESTLSAQSNPDGHVEKRSKLDRKSEDVGQSVCRLDIQRLEEILQAEREERDRLEREKEKLRQEKEILEEQRDRERGFSGVTRDEREHLEQEVLQYREQVSALQDRLDSVTKEFDMSAEDLSETLLQIKAFRMQQESREGLSFLCADGKVEDMPRELVNIQATHAETVLELQKTRNLLLVEHQISKDLKEELKTVGQKIEREREESRKRMAEKDKLLSKRALQINTLQVSGCQPNYGFTSRYALTARDLGRLGGQGSRVRVELHQALGGVQFVTHGSGQMSLVGAMERRGERINGCVNVTGPEAEIVGVVDFWVRLFPAAEPMDTVSAKPAERRTAAWRSPVHISHGWQDSGCEELHDYGGGIPNQLVVMLERCVGLDARWPGLLPDAYLTYRFYDLPPHVSQTVQCTADPVFNDTTSYPLAVTADVLHYMRSSSLWVYVFDDSDEQMPPAYLAKTPIPLRTLATGREIRGDYVLRDPAGGPRGMVRVMIKWRYPLQTPVDDSLGRQGRQDSKTESTGREERRREEAEGPQKPIAKPRVKPQPPPGKQKSPQNIRPELNTHVKPLDTPAAGDSEAPDSSESSSSQSTLIIIPPKRKIRKRDKLRVEILSLTFEPSSRVALDKSVQRVYVEYRLLGVPMETTETPMSLRKPTEGEEVHYNFTRVIYVDGSQSAPLRQYLYTMLEGTDPNQGRLQFTVVSEPMDDDEECVDVGHASLDLQELLLTGNNVIEQQIDIVSMDEDKEVIGNLKVSLEAAKALTGIYQEFHQQDETKEEDKTEGEEEELEEDEKEKKEADEQEEVTEKDQIKVIDYDDDSDF
ncbi:hypothetical protein F2P81_009599 [Scophthalmus maximus]|uniref:C2 domain-containing protein n=1 Tax=Scophthalmus maximus TaxID=52904 RepID=A0A6A4T207_SCOMX|nr:hypothetical protein F2P81_009599 [Scophthalmus maximus]